MPPFKAILFDLDGTLVNSLEDLADSMNSILKHHDFPQHGLDAYKYFVGQGIEYLVRSALPEGEFDSSYIKEMSIEYSKRMFDKTRPYAGIPELLDRLTQKHIPLCVFSNKPDDKTRKIIDKIFPQWKFSMVRGAFPHLPIKPDPAGALAIAKKLALEAVTIVYLGDTKTDMETARRAGMYAVGVLWGFRSEEELVSSGAELTVRHPLEVMELFE